MPFPCLPPSEPPPSVPPPNSRPARLGPARSGVSGKPYRRLSRDKGGLFGMEGRWEAAGRTRHEETEDEGATLNKEVGRGGPEGLGGPTDRSE